MLGSFRRCRECQCQSAAIPHIWHVVLQFGSQAFHQAHCACGGQSLCQAQCIFVGQAFCQAHCICLSQKIKHFLHCCCAAHSLLLGTQLCVTRAVWGWSSGPLPDHSISAFWKIKHYLQYSCASHSLRSCTPHALRGALGIRPSARLCAFPRLQG